MVLISYNLTYRGTNYDKLLNFIVNSIKDFANVENIGMLIHDALLPSLQLSGVLHVMQFGDSYDFVLFWLDIAFFRIG